MENEFIWSIRDIISLQINLLAIGNKLHDPLIYALISEGSAHR